jgi:hypothetical protein
MPEIAQASGRALVAVREFYKSLSQPHRRAAFAALIKSSLLLGAVSELGWLLNTHYFSRLFPQLPISLAMSMLSVIFLIMCTQVSCSMALKSRSERRERASAEVRRQLRSSLAGYVSGDEIGEESKQAAKASPKDFEASVTSVLLGLRGSALQRLCELPEVMELRLKWIEKSRIGDSDERRHALEQLGLLRDPALIAALENALEDSVAGVVASAVRGLLQERSYERRDELIRSLPARPYLVRVLTACEAFEELSRLDVRYTLQSARVRGIQNERTDAERAHCSVLATRGGHGRDLLRLMAAVGEAGEAPAEALGESLVAAARGGKI